MILRVILICLPALAFAQGPLDGYLKGRGILSLSPSFSFHQADAFIGTGGQAFDVPYRGQSLSLFAAYGLSPSVDLVGTAAAVFTRYQSGLQDGGLFVKYRPFFGPVGTAGKLALLLGGGATFPLSRYEPAATGALGQRAVTLPVKCIVQWDTPLGLFLNVTGGYHVRLDRLPAADVARVQAQWPDYQPVRPDDFSTFLVKAGFPARHFYADLWMEWQHTAGGSDYVPGVPNLAQSFGVSYRQFGGTLYYSDNGRSGFVFSAAYTPGGRNVSRISRFTFGYVWNINCLNASRA